MQSSEEATLDLDRAWLETIIVGDEEIAARELPLRIGSSAVPSRRHEMGLSLEDWAKRHARKWFEACVLADSHAEVIGAEFSVGPQDVLAATEDLADAALDWLRHREGWMGRTSPRWNDFLWAIRAVDLDGFCLPRGRSRRLADGLKGLGFDRELDRLRLDPPHGGVTFMSRLRPVHPPLNVRLLPSEMEWGWLSEIAAVHGLGRGLALVLVAPALPKALKGEGTVAYSVGALFAQLLADPLFLVQARALDPRSVETLRRHTASILVLILRAYATLATPMRSLEDAAEAMARALRLDALPPVLCGLTRATRARAMEPLEGWMTGLAAATALRDRYDDDWFRNPRAAEPIRAASQRGTGLEAREWCAELGVEISAAFGRLAELMR